MQHQKGFSLVELMIALTLGLVLMAGVMQMFLGSRAAYSNQQAVAHIQETGRLALEFLARDIRMAGYMGCSSKAMAQLDSVVNSTSFQYNVVGVTADATKSGIIAIRGYSSEPTGSDLSPDPLAGTDLLTITRSPESDITVTRNKETNTLFGRLSRVDDASCPDDSDRLDGVCKLDMLIVTDCKKGRVFQATNITSSSDEIHITHGASGPPGNKTPGWGGVSDATNNYEEGSQILKIERTTYYIAKGRSGRPSLWQKTGSQTYEILEGVENMYITYGRDTNGDGIPDTYNTAAEVDAAGAVNWFNVLSVRLQLLVQSMEDGVLPEKQIYSFGTETNKEATDHRLRQVFISTIGIRSRLK